MKNLLFRSSDDRNVNDKPKIYLICHPAEIDRILPEICGDMFATHSCTVFYGDTRKHWK